MLLLQNSKLNLFTQKRASNDALLTLFFTDIKFNILYAKLLNPVFSDLIFYLVYTSNLSAEFPPPKQSYTLPAEPNGVEITVPIP